MKKIFLIIFGLALLVGSLSYAIDGYDIDDEICRAIKTESTCQNTTASNTSLNCCWQKISYKDDNDNKKEEKECVAVKKDKDIIKKVKEEYEKNGENVKDFKFNGLDCNSQIMTLSYGLFLLFALFY